MNALKALLLALCVAACGANTDDKPDSGVDAGTEPDAGTGPDAGTDAGTEPDAGQEVVPGYDLDVKPLIDANCGFCHGESAMGGLDLRMDFRTRLVNVPSEQLPSMVLVAPGSSDESYLWHKLASTHAEVGGSGMRMPPGQSLAEEGLSVVKAWIAGNCPD